MAASTLSSGLRVPRACVGLGAGRGTAAGVGGSASTACELGRVRRSESTGGPSAMLLLALARGGSGSGTFPAAVSGLESFDLPVDLTAPERPGIAPWVAAGVSESTRIEVPGTGSSRGASAGGGGGWGRAASDGGGGGSSGRAA